MMRGGLVLRGCMALRAQSVAGRARPLAVRLVTVRARDAGVRHPALQKRAVRIHLAALLAVLFVAFVGFSFSGPFLPLLVRHLGG